MPTQTVQSSGSRSSRSSDGSTSNVVDLSNGTSDSSEEELWRAGMEPAVPLRAKWMQPRCMISTIIGHNPPLALAVSTKAPQHFLFKRMFACRQSITFNVIGEDKGDVFGGWGTTICHDMTYDGLRVLLARVVGDYPSWTHIHVWYRNKELKGDTDDLRLI
jgi:hypothetical protein